uniref:Reverse transcriptase domain-containing protein n=1 Tax=Phytophthora ramorum TaxID=164328 RepID=H3GYD1_PHYRM
MRALRNQVQSELARVGSFSLHHIDRQDNAHADRLANRALDLRRTVIECGIHCDGVGCTATTTEVQSSSAPEIPTRPVADDHDEHEVVDVVDVCGVCGVCGDRGTCGVCDVSGDIDDGEVYAAMRTGPDAVPARRPRLRLRKLTDEEQEEAGTLAERLGATLAAKIADARDWESAEGYITALPYLLYDKLLPYSQGPARSLPVRQHQRQQQQPDGQFQRPTQSRSAARRQRRQRHRARRRPPRVTRHHREHRLDEALDDLHAVERATPSDRRSIRRARRRVGRVNSAVEQQRLRHHFDTNEKGCVEILLAKARAQRSTTVARTAVGEPNSGAAEDDGTCPIPSERLHRHFTEVNTPGSSFDAMAPVGAPFRAALAHLPAATEASELLTEAPTPDEIEDQLQRAKGTTSPGLDGVGYDVYKAFSTQLLPVLHAAFQCCWQHHRVPQSRKQGIVRLLYKKGPREDPANWRPICLQQVIYKTYAGVLARRFTRWLAANGRHADAQKGFRTVNGCGEHNFLASTLIDHARRSRRELHMVWYDLKNAFGSVPQELLWEVLQRMGVPPAFVEVCQGLYQDAAFTVGNAADGPTDLVRQLVGVFQGCPLSPHLFTAAISPLLHALDRLKDTGVRLSADDRPGASAYADDLKIFSGTADGVKRQHALVADFLRWTGMVANPNKCCTMSVQRDGRGVLKACDLELQLDGARIPSLIMNASYAYLGTGDGFDHVRRRIELVPALMQLKDDATALLQSGLAPCQVVKAVKTYLFPRVEYALRHLRPFQQQLEGFNRHLVCGLRHLLRLPVSATTSFFFVPLRLIADRRHRLDPDHWKEREEKICELRINSQLGTSAHAPPKRRNGDIGSLWVDVQRHLRGLGLKLETAPACAETGTAEATLQLRVPHHEKWLDHRTVLRQVKLHMKNKHWQRWAGMKDQGKTARTHGGAGSGFLTRPRGLWETDYRFAVAGRLNQLDTHSVLKRRRLRAHDQCRQPGCSRAETLAHVLNHCAGTMDADRAELRVNQTVPSLAGPALRPDLQLFNHTKKTVAVVDLAVAFEEQASDDTESSALARIAAHKRAKYAGIKRHLERQGWKVHLSALVYGSLGAVMPANYKVLTEHLGLLKRDAKRLDRQLSVACIQSSRRIWNLHCAQHRARQHQGQAPRGSRAAETGGTPPQSGRR